MGTAVEAVLLFSLLISTRLPFEGIYELYLQMLAHADVQFTLSH